MLTISSMLTEICRLALGLSIALFHRPIADFILEYERSLVIMFRERGLAVPAAPTRETIRNIYFILGISIAMFELARIYMLLHPLS